MNSVPVYQYTIPLEETVDGFEAVYDYPEGDEHTKYEKGRYLVVIQDKVIPHFHKDSIPVKVGVLVEGKVEHDAESSQQQSMDHLCVWV